MIVQFCMFLLNQSGCCEHYVAWPITFTNLITKIHADVHHFRRRISLLVYCLLNDRLMGEPFHLVLMKFGKVPPALIVLWRENIGNAFVSFLELYITYDWLLYWLNFTAIFSLVLTCNVLLIRLTFICDVDTENVKEVNKKTYMWCK